MWERELPPQADTFVWLPFDAQREMSERALGRIRYDPLKG